MAVTDAIYSFLSDEVGRNAVVSIETGTDPADPNYSADHLHDENPAQPAKILSNTAAWQWVFGAPQDIQWISLIHATFDAGVDLKLQARHDTSDWSTPDFEVALTVPPWLGSGNTAWPVNLFKILTGETGYDSDGWECWRLICTGNSQNVWVGQAWLSTAIRYLTPNYRWGYTKTRIRPVVENRSAYGISTVYDRGTNLFEFACNLKATDSLADDLLDQWIDVGGRAHPFMFVADPTKNDASYVRWKTSEEPMQVTYRDYIEMSLVFEEVARGLRPGV